jgi:magnesium chelatase family protein
MPALVGGGTRAKPGEVSLAHNGVLFLDELPEFTPQVLDSLRQPLETGEVTVARANAHVRYPARVQLVAAMNPCRCGLGGAGKGACGRAPRCLQQYQSRISGPLMDRIDLHVEVPPVTAADLALPRPAEGTAEAAARVAAARAVQEARGLETVTQGDRNGQVQGPEAYGPGAALNARLEGRALERFAAPDDKARALLTRAAETGGLSARGWTRTLRLARTIADLDGAETVGRTHVAEALIYRPATRPTPAHLDGDTRVRAAE